MGFPCPGGFVRPSTETFHIGRIAPEASDRGIGVAVSPNNIDRLPFLPKASALRRHPEPCCSSTTAQRRSPRRRPLETPNELRPGSGCAPFSNAASFRHSVLPVLSAPVNVKHDPALFRQGFAALQRCMTCKDFRRCHQNPCPPASDRAQKRHERNQRLARSQSP